MIRETFQGFDFNAQTLYRKEWNPTQNILFTRLLLSKVFEVTKIESSNEVYFLLKRQFCFLSRGQIFDYGSSEKLKKTGDLSQREAKIIFFLNKLLSVKTP